MGWSRSEMLKSTSSNWHSQNQTNNNKNSLAPEENQVIILKTGFKKWKPLFSPTLPINIIVQGEPNSLEHIHFATLNDLMDLEQGSWIAPNITHTHTHIHTKDVIYLIKEVYNPTPYIDERGEDNPNELHQTSRSKHQLRCQRNMLTDAEGKGMSQIQAVGISTGETT